MAPHEVKVTSEKGASLSQDDVYIDPMGVKQRQHLIRVYLVDIFCGRALLEPLHPLHVAS